MDLRLLKTANYSCFLFCFFSNENVHLRVRNYHGLGGKCHLKVTKVANSSVIQHYVYEIYAAMALFRYQLTVAVRKFTNSNVSCWMCWLISLFCFIKMVSSKLVFQKLFQGFLRYVIWTNKKTGLHLMSLSGHEKKSHIGCSRSELTDHRKWMGKTQMQSNFLTCVEKKSIYQPQCWINKK